MDNNEEEFLTCARYGLMLAEQMGDDFIRASLLKLVRAWLAAAKEIEKAANNVLGSVGIHREFITAAARWIMAAKL